MTGVQTGNDAALVRRVADGDATALRELYAHHSPWLYARLLRRCNDREVVHDVLQDTFVAVWKEARSWRGDGEVAGWMWGIAFRRLASRLRRHRDVLLLPDWDTVPERSAVPAAEEQVLLGVEYGDLAGALRGLAPEFRAVVQACVLDGLSAREAGRLLGVRENTVRTRLHRAKAQLRTSLAADGATGSTGGWR
jgi:RNA polymerase sigma-70 factor (ECF subfamily)